METQLENRWNSIIPVPYVNKIGSVCLGIVNIIIPGLGLALATCLQIGRINTYFLILALCQFIMAFIVIGWIWAIVNGIFMIVMPFTKKFNQDKQKYEEECKEKRELAQQAEEAQVAEHEIQQA